MQPNPPASSPHTHFLKQLTNINQKHIQQQRSRTCPIIEDPLENKDDDNTTNISITQKELQSHQIIRELLRKSKLKVVERVPQGRKETSMQALTHKMHLNAIAQMEKKDKIKKIYEQLKKQTPMWLRIKRSVSAKPLKKANHQQHHSKSISVSALASYHFKSVKSTNRVAFMAQGDLQTEKRLERSREHSQCAKIRSEKLHVRSNPLQADMRKELNTAISHSYPELTTEEYLKVLRKESTKDQLVYGSKLKHLSSMAQVMNLQEMSHQQAQLVVTQIKPLVKPGKGAKHRKEVNKSKQEHNNLERRRLPISYSKIIGNISYDG